MWLVLGFAFLITSMWPLFDTTNFVPEFLNQARIHISIVFVLVMAFALWKKKSIVASAIAAILVFNTYWVASSYPSLTSDVRLAGTPFRLFSQNIYSKNKDITAVIEEIKASEADTAVLIEVWDETYEELAKGLAHDYPYARHSQSHKSKPGIALFSKYPLVESQSSQKRVDRRLAILNDQILYGDQLIEIVGLHLDSPLNKKRIVSRNKQLELVEQYISTRKADPRPLIVVGDMNTAPWNPKFRQFQKYANLSNADSYLDIKQSWPTWLPTSLGFPIDHVLINDSFCEASKHRVGMAGSDHYGFVSDLYICGEEAGQLTKVDKGNPFSS